MGEKGNFQRREKQKGKTFFFFCTRGMFSLLYSRYKIYLYFIDVFEYFRE